MAYKGITTITRMFEIIGALFLIITVVLCTAMLYEGMVYNILPVFHIAEAKEFLTIVLYLASFMMGCVDSMDIDEKLIVTTLAFDLKDGEIWCYLETPNTEAGMAQDTGKSTGNKYNVVKGHRKTLPETRDNLKKSPIQLR